MRRAEFILKYAKENSNATLPEMPLTPMAQFCEPENLI